MNYTIFRPKVIFLEVIFLLFCSGNLFALTLQSGIHKTALIELYTSEGCSSCVPADERMNDLLKEKGLWKDFVPVVFHVSYWDYIGWRDRFAAPEFTERQKKYSKEWGQTSIYTPCFALNGNEWTEWLTARELPENKKEIEVGVLKIASSDLENFSAEFSPKQSAKFGYDIHIALLGFDIRSEVTAGENMGRTLSHNFMVLDYKKLSAQKSENNFQTSWKFEKLPSSDLSHYGVVAWVSLESELMPIQVVGGMLNGVNNGTQQKK